MESVPIASLAPSTEPPADKSIRGVVTLSWPYSSSTRQYALLLADPDFRLRARQGQVRVRFTGASAEAVARERVGIGDEVVLSLHGASWEEDPEATRTPGRSVAGELFFRRKLGLKIVRGGGYVEVEVDAAVSPPPRPQDLGDRMEIVTPLPKAVGKLRESREEESLPSYTYTSPAFAKRLRLSGESFLDSAYDPFAEDGTETDMKRADGGQRKSFGGNMRWRYAEKTPSPTKDTFGRDAESPSIRTPSKDAAGAEVDRDGQKSMLPPPLPRLELPKEPVVEQPVTADQRKGPSTPKLQPVESTTLPLPSPFPTETSQPQFGPAASVSAPQTQQLGAPASTTHMGEQYRPREGEDVVEEDESREISTKQSQPIEILSDTEPGTGPEAEANQQKFVHPEVVVEDDVVQDQDGEHTVDDTAKALYDEFIGLEETKTVGAEREDERETLEQHEGHSLPKAPETPTKAIKSNNLGLDVTTSAPSSNQVTPQSEKDRVMKRTYSSLFGFKASPGPELRTEQNQESVASGPALDGVSEISRAGLEVSGVHDEESKEPALEAASHKEVARMSPMAAVSKPPEPVSTSPEEPPPPSAQQSEVEVIDLLSSSEEGDESTDEREPATVTETVEHDMPGGQELSVQELSVQTTTVTDAADLGTSSLVPQGPVSDLPQSSALESLKADETSLDEAQTEDQVKSTGTAVDLEKASPSGDGLREPPQAPPPQAPPPQAPLYPKLPLSPSNSQSLQDMPFETTVGTQVQETAQTVLPPTPQLTQTEPSFHLQEILEKEDIPSQSTEADVEPLQKDQTAEEINREPEKKKKPVRKSATSRISNVPNVISEWFSPKRSSGVPAKDGEREDAVDKEETQQTVQDLPNGHVLARQSSSSQRHNEGFSTTLSYFTPLSRLEELLNPPSQQTYGAISVDIFAVVTDKPKEPARAKGGPRDYYTIFRVTDTSSSPNTSVRVEVFRPWKATLPVAEVGDTILLRGFTVKSRKRQPYLLSTDASAWCVWRYQDDSTASNEDKKPIWARKFGEGQSGEAREEMKGPPVELGEEEREHATRLRSWWQDRGDNALDDDVTINGHAAQAVVAKL